VKYFEPYTFQRSGLKVANRIALSPMTNKQSHEDGTLSDGEYKWLIRRGKEGFGVLFSCAANVSMDGKGWNGELGVYSDLHLEGLTQLAQGIRACHSTGLVQLYHGGARSPEPLIGCRPWSAVDHMFRLGKHEVSVRAATEVDIRRVINDFKVAALRCQQAGFDGVELHAAHGYLLHQFLSTENQRNDRWGGRFENRIRLLMTIVSEIKSVINPNFLVGIRLTPEDKYTYKGTDFDESLHLAEQLIEVGIDFLDVSTWDYRKSPDKYPDSGQPIISWYRSRLGTDFPLFVAGDIWDPTDAMQAMQYGADFVCLGKAAIGVPDWPSKARQSEFKAPRPPYTKEHLAAADLSQPFIDYMSKWENFVVSE